MFFLIDIYCIEKDLPPTCYFIPLAQAGNDQDMRDIPAAPVSLFAASLISFTLALSSVLKTHFVLGASFFPLGKIIYSIISL